MQKSLTIIPYRTHRRSSREALILLFFSSARLCDSLCQRACCICIELKRRRKKNNMPPRESWRGAVRVACISKVMPKVGSLLLARILLWKFVLCIIKRYSCFSFARPSLVCGLIRARDDIGLPVRISCDYGGFFKSI